MKTALFVLLDQYADWEAAYLLSLLNQRDDWQIQTASNLPLVHSIGGLQTTVDLNFSEIDRMYHLLVLVGGDSWNIQNQELYRMIEKQLNNNLPVAGYKHTGNSRVSWQDFQNYRSPENFIERQAVSDRNLVTANGTAALDFTEFVSQLIGDSLIEAKKEVDLYRLGYYGYREKYGYPFDQ